MVLCMMMGGEALLAILLLGLLESEGHSQPFELSPRSKLETDSGLIDVSVLCGLEICRAAYLETLIDAVPRILLESVVCGVGFLLPFHGTEGSAPVAGSSTA